MNSCGGVRLVAVSARTKFEHVKLIQCFKCIYVGKGFLKEFGKQQDRNVYVINLQNVSSLHVGKTHLKEFF